MVTTIRAYYDGSGNPRDSQAQFLTLAGYAGTANAWQAFEKKWASVLQRHGCEYLHMREAWSLVGEFAKRKGWAKEKVQSLLADLFNECLSPIGWQNFKGQFYGASCIVNLADYKKAHIEMPQLKEPESICVDFVVTIALMALPENLSLPFGKEGTIQLFFDKNEPFRHKVERTWRKKPRKKLEHPLRLVSSIEEADLRDVIGLQAADFLAWSTNRYYVHGLTERGAFAGIARVLASPVFERYYDYNKLQKEFCHDGEEDKTKSHPKAV